MIVAYTYQAELLCPGCVSEHIFGVRYPDPEVESYLDEEAEVEGFDREDERSFDSGYFPKVVFDHQVGTDRCDHCGEELV